MIEPTYVLVDEEYDTNGVDGASHQQVSKRQRIALSHHCGVPITTIEEYGLIKYPLPEYKVHDILIPQDPRGYVSRAYPQLDDLEIGTVILERAIHNLQMQGM